MAVSGCPWLRADTRHKGQRLVSQQSWKRPLHSSAHVLAWLAGESEGGSTLREGDLGDMWDG